MKKVFYWSTLIFTFTIPISSFLSTKFLVIVCIISLFTGFPLKKSILTSLRKSWDILAFLLILVIGLLNTQDMATGVKVLETSSGLLAMLILFNRIDDANDKLIHDVMISFIASLLIASLLSLVNAVINFSSSGNLDVFFYYELVSPIQSHPTYLAYYLIAAITYIIYLSYYNLRNIRSFVWIPIVFFFFLILMLTGGKTAYISLLMTFSFFILKYILEEGTREKRIVFYVVVILLVSLFGVSSISYFNIEFSQQNDYWERSQLWKSAINANPNPIWGAGTGDYKAVLNEYYLSHSMLHFAKDSYNSHNQFIQAYFSNGLIGLATLLILIGRPIYLSVRSQNTLGILLMFPFIIYGVTEVFLGRYQGVVFFALLNQIVIYQQYSARLLFAQKTV